MVITDNVRLGAVDGLAGATGSGFIPGAILDGVGDPSSVVTGQTGSDIFFDSANGQYYMSEGAGTEDWIKLGSVA